MADTNRRVTFDGVDNGVSSMIDKIRRTAEQTTKDLIRQAREYSTSGKEVLRYIEDEIRAIEKRDAVYQRSRRMQLEHRAARAMERATTDEQRSQIQENLAAGRAEIGRESQQEKLMVDMMRELIDTVQSTARTQIAEDRKNVEQTLESNENLSQRGLAESADEFNELTQTLQRQQIGEVNEQEDKETREYRRARNKKVESATQRAAAIGGMDNEIYMAAGLAAMIPFVGQGISMIAQKFMQKGEELERAAGGVYGMTGRGLGPTLDPKTGEWSEGIGYDKSYTYGKTQAEFLQGYVNPLGRAMGGFSKMDDAAIEQAGLFALMAERGMGVDVGTQMGSARLGRGDIRFASNEERTMSIVRAFQSAGVFGADGQDLSVLPELMQLQNEIGQQQLVRLGQIDTGVNQAMTSELAGMANIFKNPDVLASVVQNLDAGLRSPANSYSQAAQFAVLRQQNPGASRWELMKMQEKGMQDPDQLRGILGRLSQASGSNKQLFFEQIKAFFPNLSLHQVEALGTGYLRKGASFGRADISAITSGQPGVDVETRSREATGTLERRTASMDEWFAKQGVKVNTYLENKMEDFGNAVDAFDQGMLKGADAVGKFIKGLGDFRSMVQPPNPVQ